MNHIFSFTASVPQYFSSAVSENLLSQLSAQQKKILVVTSLAISVFTAMMVAYRCCFTKVPPSSPVVSNVPVGNSANSSNPQIANPINSSKPSPSIGRANQPSQDLLDFELKITQQREKINALLFDIADGNVSDPTATDDQDPKVDELQSLENQQNIALDAYPGNLVEYLENNFSSSFNSAGMVAKIYPRFVLLSDFLDGYSNHPNFVKNCLTQINAFLNKEVFFSGLYLDEQHKIAMLAFQELFAIANKHLPTIQKEDPALAMQLKIKLANLPLRDEIQIDSKGEPIMYIKRDLRVPYVAKVRDRKAEFPNVYLSQKEQLDLLVDYFKAQEDDLIKKFIALPQGSISPLKESDIKKLARMASKDKSLLSHDNKNTLRNCLQKQLSISTSQGGDTYTAVEKAIMKAFNRYVAPKDIQIIEALHRASKAKWFFERQLNKNEDEIHIPRWYHATADVNVKSIINSLLIKIMHKQEYEGAWVGDKIVRIFGTSVLVFNHKITELDINVFIGYQNTGERWRGLQVPIPLKGAAKAHHLCLIGLAQKDDKKDVRQELSKQGLDQTIVYSTEQVDYIQAGVCEAMGVPNLSDRWWGVADYSALDNVKVS